MTARRPSWRLGAVAVLTATFTTAASLAIVVVAAAEPAVEVSPASAAMRVGTRHCLTASVAPSPGRSPVLHAAFEVTGANPATATVALDAAGVAQHCYSGAVIGTDRIVARIGPLSATATWTWVSGPFSDTIFSSGPLRSLGSVQAIGSIYARGAIDLSPKSQPIGEVRSRASITVGEGQRALSLWAGGNLSLGPNVEVMGNARACGATAAGDVSVGQGDRIARELQFKGRLTPDPLPPSVLVGSLVRAGCDGPPDLDLPGYQFDPAAYAGWRVITIPTVAQANSCLAQRTASACGSAPGLASPPQSLGLPAPEGNPQGGGTVIRIQDTACTEPVRLGGNIIVTGNVTISTKCRVDIAENTKVVQAGAPNSSQVVVVSESATGINDLLVGANFLFGGASTALLLYTAGQLIVGPNVRMAGALYGSSVRLGPNLIITGSPGMADTSPPGFRPGTSLPPVAEDVSATTREDIAVAVTLVASDAEADPLLYEIVSGPAHGAVAGDGAARTYTPAADYFGPDSFTYRARDGSHDSNTATVRLVVQEVNDAPQAGPDERSVKQGTSLTFAASELTANDRPGPANEATQALSLTKVTGGAGAHGEVSLAGGMVTYTPERSFTGGASFSYTVCDNGTTAGAPDPRCVDATVTVTVVANRAPVAASVPVLAAEDTPLDIVLGATDADGDPLSFTVVGGPVHGTLSGTGANRTYTPEAEYNGADSFTFRVNDGMADSTLATVSVTVREVNDPPTAAVDTKATAQGQVLSFPASDLTANDATGPANESAQQLVVASVAAVAGTQGTVDLAAGAVRYAPDSAFSGTARFAYRVCDNGTTAGAADPRCADGVVNVTVAPNHPPVASQASYVTSEDTPLDLTLGATDADGDPLSYAIVTGPAHGTVSSGSGAGRTYTPGPDYNGADSFTFTASDGKVDSNVTTVSVTVREVNDPPVVVGDGKATAQGDVLAFPATDLLANDSPGPASESAQRLAVTSVSASGDTHGTVDLASGTVTYRPEPAFNGTAKFTYRACDNGTTAGVADPRCADGTVEVAVAAKRPPVANSASAIATEDTALDLTLVATDPDGDPLTFTIVAGPARGAVSAGTGSNRTYTPDPDYNGSDSFTFRANDGSADSNVATVSVTVREVNDPPVAAFDLRSTPNGRTLTFPAAGLLDNDRTGPANEAGQRLAVTAAAGGPDAHGSVELAAGVVTYAPAAGFSGPARFAYTVCDDGTSAGVADPQCAAGIVEVAVGVNGAPSAEDGSVTVNEDTVAGLMLVATDPDGQPLTFTVSDPNHGTVSAGTVAARSCSPAPDYNGPDSFTFRVSDGMATSNVATVTVTVREVNDPPVATDDTVNAPFGAPRLIPVEDLLRNDRPGPANESAQRLTLTSIASPPSHGALTLGSDNLTYIPVAGFTGSDRFAYNVCDDGTTAGAADPRCTSGMVEIMVSGNVAPVASDLSITTDEDANANLALVATDPEGRPLTYTVVTSPAHGTVSVGPSAARTYTPAADYSGPDSFTFKANDGTADSNVATVSVIVREVNDPPRAGRDARSLPAPDTVLSIPTVDVLANDTPGPANEAAQHLNVTKVTATPDTHGTVVLVAGAITYTREPFFTGKATFAYTVCDDGTTAGTPDPRCTEGAVDVTVSNHVPVATDVTAATEEETATTITLTGADADGDPLTWSVATGPAHGTLGPLVQTVCVVPAGGTCPPAVLYTPTPDYNGPDTLTFKVSDGTADSVPATVTINVREANDPPVLAVDARSVPPGVPLVMPSSDLVANDRPGPPNESAQQLTVTMVTATANTHGTVDLTSGTVTYTPESGFGGNAIFAYTACDDGLTLGLPSPLCAESVVDVVVEVGEVTLPYSSEGWRYRVVGHGEMAGFQEPAFDDSTFALGAGAFGSGGCGLEPLIHTPWPTDTDMLLRRNVSLDPGTTDVTVGVGIDNDVEVYWNGQLIGSNTHEFCPGNDSFVYVVPEELLRGGANMLAIRGIDRGSVSYLDAQVRIGRRQPISTSVVTGQYFPGSTDGTFNALPSQTSVFTQQYPAIHFNPPPTDIPGNASGVDTASRPFTDITTDAFGNYAGTITAEQVSADGTVGPQAGVGPLTDFQAVYTATLVASRAGDVTFQFLTGGAFVFGVGGGATRVGGSNQNVPATTSFRGYPVMGGFNQTSAEPGPRPVTVHFPAAGTYEYEVDYAECCGGPITLSMTVGDTLRTPTPLRSIALTPAAPTTFDPNTAPSITAIPTDEKGARMLGVDVTLHIRGVNNSALYAHTNAAGVATFTYSGRPGDDYLQAFLTFDPFGSVSNVARIHWSGNSSPEARDGALTATEDAALSVVLTASDRDGDALTYSIASGPAHGRLEPAGSGGAARTYIPDPDYNGPDTFTFRASDGMSASNAAAVSITVGEVNDPPAANGDTKATRPGTATAFAATDLAANDSPGAPNESAQGLTVSEVHATAETHGTVELVDRVVSYTPDAGFSGVARFSYTVCDDGTTAGMSDPRCAAGAVTVVVSTNEPPTARDVSMAAVEDTALEILLAASDPEGSPLTFSIASGPSHGRLEPGGSAGPSRIYTPARDFRGTDSFTYRAGDGTSESSVASVLIMVTEVNDPPTASPDAGSISHALPTTIPASILTGNDVAGPPNEADQILRVSDATGTSETRGTVALTGGDITFSPETGFSGETSFTYTVCDDGTTSGSPDPLCATGTVTVSVGSNDPPVATDTSLTVDEDTPGAMSLPATDANSDALTFTIVSGPSHGRLDPAGPGAAGRTYTPDPNFFGADAFTFKANDDIADSEVRTVSITVREANDRPDAVADARFTEPNTPTSFPAIDLLTNDSAGPSEPAQVLTITSLSATSESHGTVTLVAGTVTYAPQSGFTGAARFEYTVCDNGTTFGSPDPRCAVGVVSVVVNRPGSLASIDVTPRNAFSAVGDSRQFQALGHYADGSAVDVTSQVAWSSSNTGVATITASGRAVAVARGTTSISATLHGVSAATSFTVTSTQTTSVVVTPARAVIIASQDQAFVATAVHSDGSSEPLSGPELTWATSNTAIATITAAGVATGIAAGEVTVTATYSGGVAGIATLTVAPGSPNGSLPTVAISAPTDGATVTSPVTVTGTASDDEFLRYVLEIAPVGETTFTTVAESTTPVTNGTLGTLDPTLLINDLYTLRVTAYDRGANINSDEIVVQVDRDQKVGNFTVSFDDLTVPLSGIDVTVTRTYDSRDKGKGDFGVAWRLGVRDVRLRTTGGTLGANWVGTVAGTGFSTIYCISPGRTRTVALTMPGGEVMHFEASVEVADGTPTPGRPNCSRLAPPSRVRLVWRAASHTFGSLAIPDAPPTLRIENSAFPGPVTLYTDDEFTQAFDARRYLATLRDGTKFTVTDRSDVERISDPTGNAITITSNGITHSAGPGVVFERDAQDRITAIVDPAGNRMTYAYDVNGDLTSRADRNGEVTRFTYDRRHNLLQIVNPLGRTGVRNTYDEAGRLVTVTDADGHEVTLSHDLAGDTETVVDRRGNTSVFTYDTDGNVTTETNAESETTRHTYDADGNELTTVDGLGRTTTRTFDGNRNLLTEHTPLGNVTTFAYGAFDQVTKTVDPTGRTTVNEYDPATGNLLSTTVALTEAGATDPGVADVCRAVTRFTYDSAGNVLTQTDANGSVTTNTYDGAGRLLTTTDATGALTSYTYDANGNRTEMADPLGRVTRFEYDSENRMVRTVHPDMSSTRTVYDGAGRAVATVDELGRVTRSVYDTQGRQVRTDHPDGTSTASEYDANGNATVSVDQAGRRTVTTYDRANRPVRVTHPDGTFITTTYDDAGQVVEERDERGNPTTTHYDGDGRVDRVTRPLGVVMSSTYDAAGRKTTDTDPRGNVTSFQYDCAGRLTTTTYPATDTQPATTRVVAYDAVGRRVADTDQAGRITRFAYDALGRLTKVTDARNQDTTYTYDATGNRRTQTDARGNTTLIDYDPRNRERVRTLPLGQATTTEHDPAGNVATRLDANGRMTSFRYDVMNRLTEKVPDPVFSQPTVRFTYTATGQRRTMVDAAGTTNYTYDSQRDWLLEKAGPQGTVSYDYEPTGDLKRMASGHVGGAAMVYERDALNRITSARDTAGPPGTTAYGYDVAGNLTGVTLPNTVANTYTYDQLNRLTRLEAVGPAGPLARYEYTMGRTGNRTGVVELSGRAVAYGYDEIYRLTREAVSGDPGGINGTVDYTYDAVGNRLRRDSSLAGVPSTVATYDSDDRMSGEDYDANGNTLRNSEHTFTYDYEDRLTTADGGTMRIVYDGDGNKVAEITGGRTTTFLVDERNPTGYAQVIDELTDGALTKTYAYGLDLISQREMPSGSTGWYGYDGHGSVRYLASPIGTGTELRAYDAFGIAIGTTDHRSRYNFAGEQALDVVGLYYLRARYASPASGRFLTFDPDIGRPATPTTLHRYSYGAQDPVNRIDPSGRNWTLVGQATTSVIIGVIGKLAALGLQRWITGTGPQGGDLVREVIEAGLLSLVGFGVAALVERFVFGALVQALRPLLRSAVANGVGAFAQQLAAEYLELKKGKSFDIHRAQARVATVTILGATLGGFVGVLTNYLSTSTYQVGNLFLNERIVIGFTELTNTSGYAIVQGSRVITEAISNVVVSRIDLNS